MSASGLPPEFNGLYNSQAIDAAASGRTVNAIIVEDIGEGRYDIQTGSERLTISCPTPLNVGDEIRIRFSADGSNAEIVGNSSDLALNATLIKSISTSNSDVVSVSTPMSIEVNVSDVSEHFTNLPAGTEVAVGVAGNGSEVALHFSDGYIAQGVVSELANVDLSALAAESENAAAISSNHTTTITAADFISSFVMDGKIGESVLLVDSATLPVIVSGGEETARAEIRLPVNVLQETITAIANSSSTNALELSNDNQQGNIISFSSPDLGGEALNLAFLSTPPEGELNITLAPDNMVTLSGKLQLSANASAENLGALDSALTSIGLTPGDLTRDAARALFAFGLPLERDSVQALVTLASTAPTESRIELLASGARLIAQDIPLTPPLARGLADITSGTMNLTSILSEASTRMTEAQMAAPSEVLPLIGSAMENLASLSLPLGSSDISGHIASFLSDFGSSALASATESLEAAMSRVLSGNPTLSRIDMALNMMLDSLGDALPESGSAYPGIDSYLLPGEAQKSQPDQSLMQQARDIASQILNAPDSNAARQIIENITNGGNNRLLRMVADNLQETERNAMASNPVVSRLAEASTALSDIGRRMVAYKAETLAGMRQDPTILVAEAPFELDGEKGNGSLQMFYRRGGGNGKKNWSARVILDLHTTGLGPVVSDMKFFQKNINLRFFTESEEVSEFLSESISGLNDALQEKGFGFKPEFHLITEGREETENKIFAQRPLPQANGPHLDMKA